MNENKKQNNGEFNPLSWSILFFSLWYTLRSLNNYAVFSWFLFGLSIILLLSIYWTKLGKLLGSPRFVQAILPTIFILTVAGFIFSVLLVLKDLKNSDQIIALSLSFILLGTYLMISVSRLSKLGFRITFCLVLLALFIYRFIIAGFSGSWPLVLIILQSVWATITPNKFKKFPLV